MLLVNYYHDILGNNYADYLIQVKQKSVILIEEFFWKIIPDGIGRNKQKTSLNFKFNCLQDVSKNNTNSYFRSHNICIYVITAKKK